MWDRFLKDIWPTHKGKIVGCGLGLFVGIIIMAFGLLWSLFILALATAGYIVGKRIDDDDRELGDVLDRILPPRNR